MDLDNVKVGIKRFFKNPNTLTFLLVLVLIVVIYVVYSYMVGKATNPVSLPYATQDIGEKTEITGDMIGSISISGNYASQSSKYLAQSRMLIQGKYVATGFQIPANSFFYNEELADSDVTLETDSSNIPDGYALYRLRVDFHSTYGCAIMSGNYIDLYFKAISDTGKIIYEPFITSVQVAKVLNDQGEDVFTNTPEGQEPSPKYLEFALPDEYAELLTKADLITSNSVEIVPVPRNAGYSENHEEMKIENPAVQAFIIARSANVY